jgi:glycosyltransferase involved in cell wall biosynthesis
VNLTLVTPAINRGGGTEKCMSWLAEDLAGQCDLRIVTGAIEGTDTSAAQVHLIKTIRRPRLLAYLTFLAGNSLYLKFRRGRGAVLATSGDCLCSDFVYAHFCCAAYLSMIKQGRLELPATTLRQRLRNAHYKLFLAVAATIEQRIYRRRGLRRVIAVSDGVRDEIVANYGVDASRIEVVVNAADDKVRLPGDQRNQIRSKQRSKLGIGDDDLVLLFVAAGDWKRKGLALIIEALARMRMPNAKLLVAGSEDIAYYRLLSRQSGVARQVIFLGSVTEIETVYACADLFVYPSAYEAFPLVVLEAAATGLPMVVTRTSGTSQIVVDGDNGFVVERSAAAIADAVTKLAGDPALRTQMGSRAGASSQQYTRSSVRDAILAICESPTERR